MSIAVPMTRVQTPSGGEQPPPLRGHPADDAVLLADRPVFDVVKRAPGGIAGGLEGRARLRAVVRDERRRRKSASVTGTSGEMPNIALTRGGQNMVSVAMSTSHRPISATSVASRSCSSLSASRSSASRRSSISMTEPT